MLLCVDVRMHEPVVLTFGNIKPSCPPPTISSLCRVLNGNRIRIPLGHGHLVGACVRRLSSTAAVTGEVLHPCSMLVWSGVSKRNSHFRICDTLGQACSDELGRHALWCPCV